MTSKAGGGGGGGKGGGGLVGFFDSYTYLQPQCSCNDFTTRDHPFFLFIFFFKISLHCQENLPSSVTITTKYPFLIVPPSSITDVNECDVNNGFCSHNCKNTEGSYHCSCPPPLYLDPTDQRRCKGETLETNKL